MSNYNWCHGPNCHTQQTQSRVRGSGDNKVLRTRKINTNNLYDYQRGIYEYFCNQSCLMDFIREHLTSVIAIAPRREALETPIKVKKWKEESYRYRYDSVNGQERVPYMSTMTEIKSVDND